MRRTQRAIKHVLTERYYAWEESRKLAKTDPEVDLSGNGAAYTPTSYEDEETLEDEDENEENYSAERDSLGEDGKPLNPANSQQPPREKMSAATPANT